VSRGRIVVFARQPVRRGEDRLTPPLEPEACELYWAMLEDVLAVTAAPRCGWISMRSWPCTAGRGSELVRTPGRVRAVAQRAGAAARMAWAVAEAGAAGAFPVLLRGSDSPALAPGAIEAALDALTAVDVVIVPDPDGGYSLVGGAGSCPTCSSIR
jgi:glycosyltransferase A (GT-A) superfamily protein (DUF2064 family)